MRHISLKLVFIILLACILRFYQLGNIPPALSWDETAWGYNAYSLGIDGKDEFGRFLPHDYLESFGDFKPPVYAYLDVLPIKIFGLNEFAVRFPSALFGVLTVLATYFLVKEIFIKKEKQYDKKIEYLALLSSLILALSPWHIMLSRAAFEENVATCFIVCGVLFFLQAVNGRTWHIFYSAIFFVLSMYTFNSPRIVAPILVIVLIVSFYKSLLSMKKQVIISGIVGFLLLLPTLSFLFSPQASLRFREVNIFSDLDVVTHANQEIANDNNGIFSKFIHNRRIAYSFSYMKHYFDNLSFDFLFIHGDGNPRFSTQDVGELYLWDLPFLMLGLLFLFRNREGKWWIIPLLLFVGIIPAASARETPHALRIELSLPSFQILVAYGIVVFYSFLPTIKKRIVTIVLVLLLLGNASYFLYGYYFHYPQEYASQWQYGYKQSIAYVNETKQDYKKIYVTDFLGRPYVYYLFYLQTDPNYFRTHAKVTRDAFGFTTVSEFGKYNFVRDIPKSQLVKGNLYIDIESHLPSNAKVLKTFDLKNGSTKLVAYTI